MSDYRGSSPVFIAEDERKQLIWQLGKLLFKAKRFWIFCHESPDGDSLGSGLALATSLSALGRPASVFTAEPIARMYRFLPHIEDVRVTPELPDGVPDAAIVTDSGNFRRLDKPYIEQLTSKGIGPNATSKNQNCSLINIDHHIDNERFGDFNLVDPSCGACGELIYWIIKQLRMPLNIEAAVNIYAAILTDTGRFAFSNTNMQTFAIASDLIRIGVVPFEVVNRVYNTRSVNQVKLLARILDTITVDSENAFFYCYVTQDILRETQTIMSDTEGVAETMKTVADFEVCFLFKEEADGSVKVSARSNGGFDVSSFAKRFGGGGHPAASGFRLPSTIYSAPSEVARELAAYKEEMRQHKREEEPVTE